MATAQSWLRGHCRLSKAAASQVVRNGRALEQLPAVAGAHAAGQLTGDQVAVIGQITAPRYLRLIADQDGDLAGIAHELTSFGVTHKHDELGDLVKKFLDQLDADGPEPDPTEERFLTITRHADGSSTGRFHLDAVGTERVTAALESINQTHRPAGDERTVGQRQADAWVQLADIHLGCGTLPLLRTVKPQVAVNVGLADLLDPTTGKAGARTGFGAVISAARARWMACDADITRIVLGPDGEPLDLGRRPGCRGPRRACEAGGQRGPFIRRLRRPAPVVGGPPPHPLDPGRRHLTRQQRAALRTPPHPGPPRLHRHPRRHGPLAHPPPRRHRDPPAPPAGRRPRPRPRRLSRPITSRAAPPRGPGSLPACGWPGRAW